MSKKNHYNKAYFQSCLDGPKSLSWVVANFLKQRRAKKVLDVGCGPGWLVRYLNINGFQTVGCDSSTEAIKIAKKVNKVDVLQASAISLPFGDGVFDAVLSVSMIEHLTKTEAKKFLTEANRVLKNSGWLFLVTPNKITPIRLINRQNWPALLEPTHKVFYTPRSLKKLLQDFHFTNFKLTFSSSREVPFDWGFPKPFFKLPKIIKDVFNFLLISTPFYYFRNSFWIAAQKV